MKYGVYRLGGIDHREFAVYLTLKEELNKHGGDVLFSEEHSGSGLLVGWSNSQKLKVNKIGLAELIRESNVIDFADTEILSTVIDQDDKNYELIDIIPRNVKIIITVNSPESLKKFNDKIKDRVIGYILKWRMPIPARFPLEKLYTTKGAIYTDFWKPKPHRQAFPEDWFIIMYCGQINYTKGFAELIDSFKKANSFNSNIKLALLGFDLAFAAKHYADKNPEDIFYGGCTLDGDNIVEALNNASVFCQANFTDQGGHAILEAIACGLPMLTIDNGYLEKEMIEEGKNGYICRDQDDLAEKMIHLSFNKDLVKSMGEYSREKAIKELSSEAVLKTTLSNLSKMGIDI